MREYHREDIGSAKGSKTMDKQKFEKAQKQWLKERRVDPHSWRCSKCLERVFVNKNEYVNVWECQTCKLPCEDERRERRLKMLEPSLNFTSMCVDCSYSGWVANMRGEWVACFCQTQTQAPEVIYDLDDNYGTSSYGPSFP